VQAVWSDGVREEVGDGATGSGMATTIGSGMTMGTPPAASRPKAGSPKDGDGDSDGVVLREKVVAPREAASMARCRRRQRRRGRENWAA
jgi:hypothetical protein